MPKSKGITEKNDKVSYKPFRFEHVLAKSRVLLFSDDIVTTRVLGKVLKRRGFILQRIKDSTDVLQRVLEIGPRLVIVDLGYPGSLEISQIIKRSKLTTHIPVIILDGGEPSSSKVIKGLESGAEDYIFKPLDTPLFLARVNVILRRMQFLENPVEIFKSGEIVLNLTAHRVFVKNRPVKLTPKEFALLYFLIRKKGQVLSRRSLVENVWEQNYFGNMRVVNSHVQSLRKKLGSAGKRIESVAGIGYRLKG